jgi:hypothetical protein
LKGKYFGVFLERNMRKEYGGKDTTMNYTRHLMNQTLLIIVKKTFSMGRTLGAYEQ